MNRVGTWAREDTTKPSPLFRGRRQLTPPGPVRELNPVTFGDQLGQDIPLGPRLEPKQPDVVCGRRCVQGLRAATDRQLATGSFIHRQGPGLICIQVG